MRLWKTEIVFNVITIKAWTKFGAKRQLAKYLRSKYSENVSRAMIETCTLKTV